MLSPEQKASVRQKAVEVFTQSVTQMKGAGAVLSETEGGYVRAEFVIGQETIPTLRFPKRNLADSKWVAATLRNLDGSITKAQISAEIADAVASLPL